jgi:hypothetical protein
MKFLILFFLLSMCTINIVPSDNNKDDDTFINLVHIF